MVRPKKFLGQHFLKNERRAEQIADALSMEFPDVLEIGPGTGVLTKYLLAKPLDLTVVEIDRESVAYLKEHYPTLKIIEGDFLKMKLSDIYNGDFSIIGNFPYNISSQIFFKALEHRQQVKEVLGMIQKEVAERIASPPGNKTYGILSVLMQAFYNVEYLFTVKPGEFFPPPKVNSAVIKFVRNEVKELPCDERMFFKVVKQAFQMRRKTLRNALKPLNLPQDEQLLPYMDKRAEQLSVGDFIKLTAIISEH
ncbi:MAG: 16S rRNA (adenine(1518)-N(6)/adenine(1519)-N(6))-dimethyltransferase RsmA [Candidatus Cyclobacteriaceae bacterium M2_1C_046]